MTSGVTPDTFSAAVTPTDSPASYALITNNHILKFGKRRDRQTDIRLMLYPFLYKATSVISSPEQRHEKTGVRRTDGRSTDAYYSLQRYVNASHMRRAVKRLEVCIMSAANTNTHKHKHAFLLRRRVRKKFPRIRCIACVPTGVLLATE